MSLFETTLRLNGFPIREAKKRLLEIQAIPEDQYASYIEKSRQAIVDFHFEQNSFYRAFLGAEKPNNWEDIPVMHKSDLQQPLAQRLSHGFSKKNSYVNKTSGSSGHPFIFAKDKFAHALSWAEFMDRYQWYDIDLNTSLQARFYGIPLDFIGYRKERLKDWLGKRYRFPIFDLSDDKLEGILSTFRKKKFNYISGYTSSIVLFAKFLQKKGIVLKEICPSLSSCLVTSEMLFESDKLLLEQTFQIPIVNEYGASELGLIGFTNKENEFVVNSESLLIEVLDENGMSVPKGIAGRIVITSLYNKAHPMIRYDIGDVGILSPSSTAKKPILLELIGRTNDIAKLPSGKTVPGLTFYYVTKSVIEDDGNVKEFVIEQSSIDAFHIVYTSEKALTDSEKKSIEAALDSYLEPGLSLTFERTAVLDRSNRGKLKQFVSKL
ncbi:MAG: phenylacetate--CoA ligase family protein [Flavobacteriaceae bacterium]|nr:phenylacetate--CoA ligase family protein [Flavobacteriaceae bacterium]